MGYWQKKKVDELILNHNTDFSIEATIKYFRETIIQRFQKYDKFVITCNKQSLDIVNMALNGMSHMGYVRGRYTEENLKDEDGKDIKDKEHKEIVYTKIPIELIPAVKQLKRERKPYD